MDARSFIRLVLPRNHPQDGADDSPHRPWQKKRVFVVVAVVAGVLAATIGGFSAIARATDSPAFCEAACHEMQPFHEAWTQGPHKQISCLDCHVDQGTLTRITHKFVSLGEVVEHIKGTVHFPLPEAPDVPNSRCVRCHAEVVASTPGFSHVEHAKRGPCVKCHSDTGHSVSLATLRKAGLVAAAYRHSVEPTASAVPGNGKANLAGHKTVSCSNCHDMAATKCVDCHAPAPNHQKRSADCTQCHSPGLRFAFTHPKRTDCGNCHTQPKNLKPAHTWKGACTKCHVATPGVDWKFTHPNAAACGDCHTPPKKHDWSGSCTYCHRAGAGKSFAFTHPPRTDCASCHSRPQGHRSGSCATCHRNRGANWAFSHPGSSATCTSCHSRPRKHDAGSCTSCHRRTGSSWAFTHPSVKSGCTQCHKRPSKHESGSCQTCHKRTGRSWAFTHPNVKSGCTNCHSKPSNHYGSNCLTCHSPRTAWASAHFTHPSIPGGQHTNKSFACSKCHPSGPPAHYCSCHGSANGPSDD